MDPAPQAQCQPAHSDSPDNFAGDDGSKRSCGFPERKYASAHSGDRETVKDQRGGIICKPFALEDDKEPPGELHSASNGEWRHGVRRRNNSAQDEADRPGKTQHKCAAAATAIVVNTTQPTASSEIGRRLNRNSRQLIATADAVDDGWQHQKEHQLRSKGFTAGRPGTSARKTPVSTNRMAGGNPEPCRDDRNRGDHGQQQDQYLNRRNH